jgi:hypothetical protein
MVVVELDEVVDLLLLDEFLEMRVGLLPLLWNEVRALGGHPVGVLGHLGLAGRCTGRHLLKKK